MLNCLEHLGLRGRLVQFLEELYKGVKCEVRVSEVLSDPFEVTTGLKGVYFHCCSSHCMLINGMVEKLREAKVVVRCREEHVAALLFADDMHGYFG